MMERQLQLQARREDLGEKPSYRDVAKRGLAPTGGGSGSSANTGGPSSGIRTDRKGQGGSDRVLPDPAMLSTVVAAVMAVLAGGNPHF